MSEPPNKLIDLHCHYLPGVDDGPEDLGTALDLVRAARANGIAQCVLTPHVYPGRWDNTLATLQPRFAAFERAVREAGIEMSMHLGAEVHLLFESLESVTAGLLPAIGGLGDRRVLLLELPDARIPPGTDRAIEYLLRHGWLPMIAHPERNKAVMDDPARLGSLRDAGVMFQLTAASVCGWFGPRVHATSMQLLDRGWADVIATDAHNLRHRPPLLTEAFHAVQGSYGAQVATALMIDTPAAILRRRRLPDQPD